MKLGWIDCARIEDKYVAHYPPEDRRLVRSKALTQIFGRQLWALQSHSATIATLARVRPLTIQNDAAGLSSRERAKVLVLKGAEVILPIEGMTDVGAEKGRLLAEIESHRTEIHRIENLLGDSAFLLKAPPHIVEKERAKLSDRGERLAKLEERLAELG